MACYSDRQRAVALATLRRSARNGLLFRPPTRCRASYAQAVCKEWLAVLEQGGKNRLVKYILLEKEGHYASSNAHVP